MAEGIIKHHYKDRFVAYSAGVKSTSVHPLAIKVMAEIGIDISRQKSKSVGEFSSQEFDCVITLCGGYAKDVCPVFTGKTGQRIHWDFVDPAETEGAEEEILGVFRKVRDEIKAKIDDFVRQLRD